MKKAKEEAKPEQPEIVQEIQPEETETPVTAIQEVEKDYTHEDLLDTITVDSDGEDDKDEDEEFPFLPPNCKQSSKGSKWEEKRPKPM